MQWSNEPNSGFTKNEKPLLPVIDNGPYGFEYVNVADQRRNPNSLLNWMERMIRMRKEVPEIGWGDFEFVRSGTKTVLAMQYMWRNNTVLFVHNLEGSPRQIRMTLQHDGERCVLVNLLSGDHSEPNGKGLHTLLMEAYGYRWFRVCGLDYLLKRDDAL